MKNPFGKRVKTKITSIDITYMGDEHRLNGLETNEPIFEVRIPFENKEIESGALEEIKKPDLHIDAVKIGKPFDLVSISPEPPIVVQYKKQTELVLKIKAPEIAYTGPLSIGFIANAKDIVHISINKIILRKGERSATIESVIDTQVQKGQVIKQDIQASALLSQGEQVTNVSASAPFAIVKTSPDVPFKINRQGSYIISLFIKVPNFSYAGPLEVEFK